MKMLGDTAIRCEKGCCRVYGKHKHRKRKGYRCERRHLKRSERNKWRAEM